MISMGSAMCRPIGSILAASPRVSRGAGVRCEENVMACIRSTLFALSLAVLPLGAPLQATPAANARIVAAIRADVAELVAGINAHDPVRATMFDAPDIVSMEAGRPPSIGAEADRQGLAMSFQHNPDWRVRLIDETVDVAAAGDMAVYRGTYWQNSSNNGQAMTQRVNFVAGFRRERDGSWKIGWSVVAAQERPHPV
jgi:ketosteroid isomerase-like protein